MQDLEVATSKVCTVVRNQGTTMRKEGILKSIGCSSRLQRDFEAPEA